MEELTNPTPKKDPTPEKDSTPEKESFTTTPPSGYGRETPMDRSFMRASDAVKTPPANPPTPNPTVPSTAVEVESETKLDDSMQGKVNRAK